MNDNLNFSLGILLALFIITTVCIIIENNKSNEIILNDYINLSNQPYYMPYNKTNQLMINIVNKPRTLTINCTYFINGNDNLMQVEYAFQSQCALLEGMSKHLIYNYSKSFAKYHVCFELENKSMGECN